MKKIIINIILILTILMGVCAIKPNEVFADFSLKEMENQASEFIKKGKENDVTDYEKINKMVVPVAQILVYAANIVLVVAVAVLAIKYMTANPEGKAKLKTQLVGLVVSTIVIFGAQFIWSVLYEFLKDI